MDADDFQDLYKLLRGSRSAIAVLDARALFLEKRLVESHQKLVDARESFVESRSRLIKQDVKKQVDAQAQDADLQIKKLKRKQDKVLDTVKCFDELLPALQKLAEREKANTAKQAADHSVAVEFPEHLEPEVEQGPLGGRQQAADSVVARLADVSQAFVESFQNAEGDELLDMISDQFGFREVQSEQDLLGDALYYIQTSKRNFLVVTPAAEQMTDTVALTSVIDDKPIKPVSRKAFLQLGTRRRMVLLTQRADQSDTGQFNTIADIPKGFAGETDARSDAN